MLANDISKTVLEYCCNFSLDSKKIVNNFSLETKIIIIGGNYYEFSIKKLGTF